MPFACVFLNIFLRMHLLNEEGIYKLSFLQEKKAHACYCCTELFVKATQGSILSRIVAEEPAFHLDTKLERL